MKKQLIKTINGEEKEISINVMDGEQMAELFKTHINMNVKGDSDNIFNMLKDASGLFHFLNDCWKLSIKGCGLNEVSGGTVQEIIQDNLQYILDLRTETEVKN